MNTYNILELAEKMLLNQLNTEESNFLQQNLSSNQTFKKQFDETVDFIKKIQYLNQRNEFANQISTFFGKQALKEKKSAYTFNLKNIFINYKALAASIISSILITGLCFIIFVILPEKNSKKIEQLGKEIETIKKNQQAHVSLMNDFKTKLPTNAKFLTGGSGILIDKKGYLITNAHILKGNGAIVVNEKGLEFNAIIIYKNINKDIAILKIQDDDYTLPASLPYKINKKQIQVGEDIFSLSFPRNNPSLVYAKGYISAGSGFNNDSITYQISMNAYQGSSGSPIFNKNGELIGILTSKESQTESIAFAIKTAEIFNLIKEMDEKDINIKNNEKINISNKNNISNLGLLSQINVLKNYIYNVKSYKN